MFKRGEGRRQRTRKQGLQLCHEPEACLSRGMRSRVRQREPPERGTTHWQQAAAAAAAAGSSGGRGGLWLVAVALGCAHRAPPYRPPSTAASNCASNLVSVTQKVARPWAKSGQTQKWPDPKVARPKSGQTQKVARPKSTRGGGRAYSGPNECARGRPRSRLLTQICGYQF